MSAQPQNWWIEPPRTTSTNCATCAGRGKHAPGTHLVGAEWMCDVCFAGDDDWTVEDKAAAREERKRLTRERKQAEQEERARVRALREETDRAAEEAKAYRRSPLPIQRAIELAAASFKVNPERLLRHTRTHKIGRPRFLAFRIASELFGVGPNRIGARFGMDHTSVLHGIRRARVLPDLAQRYEEIRRKVEAV